MPNWKKVVTSGSNAELNNIDSSGYIDITGASSDPGADGVVRLGQSSNALRVYTNDGYVQIGPTNSGWAHFYTDRSNFYFNQPIVIDDGVLASYDEDLILRRDYNDTTYNQITIGDDTYELKLDNTVRHSIDGVGNNTFTGHITASGNISASGFISASSFAGDGAGLSNVSATVGGDTFATDLKVGRDSHNHLDFTTDNQIKFRLNNVDSEFLMLENVFRPGGNGGAVLGTDGKAFSDIVSQNANIQGSITASGVISASGGFVGDGSNLTGISTDIDGLDALGGTGVAQGDKFIFSDAGTEKSITFSNLEDAIFGNVSGDATVAAGGALTIAADSVEGTMLNVNAADTSTIELSSDTLSVLKVPNALTAGSGLNNGGGTFDGAATRTFSINSASMGGFYSGSMNSFTTIGNISGSVTSTGSFGQVRANLIDANGTVSADGNAHLLLNSPTDIFFYNGGTSRFKFDLGNANPAIHAYNNFYITSNGSFNVDVPGDITLDAGGDDIHFKDGGTTRFTFNLDTTPEIDVTGNLNIDPSGGNTHFDSHITASGNISASGTITSNTNFSQYRKFDVTTTPAGETYSSAGQGMGDIIYIGNTSTDAGKVYYYQTNNTWALTDASDNTAGADELLAVALGSNSTTNGMLLRGVVRMSGAPAGADHDGRAVYMSETAGAVTTTAPSSTNNVIRVCGYLTDNLKKQIWFNPSSTWVKHS